MRGPVAHVLIRTQPSYRSESFAAGLTRQGYAVQMKQQVTPGEVKPHDVVVTWNAYGRFGIARAQADRVGARTLVAENGYFGKDNKGRQYYALAEHGHVGSGRWRYGGHSRFSTLSLDMGDWRSGGEYVLVCGQRGIGEDRLRSPYGWEDSVQAQIKKITNRKIRVRLHPGRHKIATSLEQDLERAWAVVVWSSNCASTALMMGIPVFYCGPHIALQGAARPFAELAALEAGSFQYPNREKFFGYAAWAQWSVAELESGYPFELLLKENDMPWVGGWRAEKYW